MATAGMFYIDGNRLIPITSSWQARIWAGEPVVTATPSKLTLADDWFRQYERAWVWSTKLSEILRATPTLSSFATESWLSKVSVKHLWKSNAGLRSDDQMPRWCRRIYCGNYLCTNTSNPRNVVAAALVAKKANQLIAVPGENITVLF